MKKEFEMTQQEMDDIIAINKNMPPVIKIGNNWSGLDLEERINAYWEMLADKYGFDTFTVEPHPKGGLFFTATDMPMRIKKKTGIELIADEIDRAINVEGWKDTSDYKTYGSGQMAGAAACYALESINKQYGVKQFAAHIFTKTPADDILYEDAFPWDRMYDKRHKHDRIKVLTIAGSWIVREIDRLLAQKNNP